MNYKITKADLIGEIENFPIEVVEKMIEQQVKQGRADDVGVFQIKPTANHFGGGFTWKDTEEGEDFWRRVIVGKDFKAFFNKYPREKTHHVYIYQNGTKNGSDVIKTLEKRGGNNGKILVGNGYKAYYYIHPRTKLIDCITEGNDILPWVKTFYTEIDVEPHIKEYTMQEIADKLGIDVTNLRIKK